MRPRVDSMRLMALLLANAVTTGCVTTTDPAKGGFVNGVSGIVNGSYQRRVDSQQEHLDELAETRDAMNGRLYDVDKQRAGLSAEQQSLEGKLTELRKQSEQSRRQLEEIRRQHLMRSDELEAIGAERNAVERRLITLMKRYGIEGGGGILLPLEPKDAEELREIEATQHRLDDTITRRLAAGSKR